MRRDILVQGAHADTFICRKLNSGVLEMKKEKLELIRRSRKRERKRRMHLFRKLRELRLEDGKEVKND